jgi:hypothetical protein
MSRKQQALDLINEFKVSSSEQKVYLVAQLKEICFKQAPHVLFDVAQDIFDLSLDRSAQVRRALIMFAGECVYHNEALVPAILSMFYRLLEDRSESLVRAMAFEMARSYDRFIVSLAKAPESSAAARTAYSQLQDIAHSFLDTLSTEASEQVRTQCVRFALETYVLFGLPSPKGPWPLKEGDQLRMGQFYSCADLPATHAFVQRDSIEAEAAQLFIRCEGWCRSGGPSSSPFSTSQLSQLAQAVGRVGSERPMLWARAATALLNMVFSKNKFFTLNISAETRKQVSIPSFLPVFLPLATWICVSAATRSPTTTSELLRLGRTYS